MQVTSDLSSNGTDSSIITGTFLSTSSWFFDFFSPLKKSHAAVIIDLLFWSDFTWLSRSSLAKKVTLGQTPFLNNTKTFKFFISKVSRNHYFIFLICYPKDMHRTNTIKIVVLPLNTKSWTQCTPSLKLYLHKYHSDPNKNLFLNFFSTPKSTIQLIYNCWDEVYPNTDGWWWSLVK